MKIQTFTNKVRLLLASLLLLATAGMFAQGGQTCAMATPAVVGLNTTATLTGTGVSNGCFATLGTAAAWYSFTPTMDGTIGVSSCGGGVDTRLSVYSGACGATTCIASADDSPCGGFASEVTGVPVCAGETYFIEWDDRWSATGFNWTLTFTPGVLNPGSVSASMVTATSATVTVAGCATGAYQIEYGPVGFTPGTGTVVAVPASGVVMLSGLPSGTTFGVTATSTAAGVPVNVAATTTFSTLIAPLTCADPLNTLTDLVNLDFDTPPTLGLPSTNNTFTASWNTGTATGSGGTGPSAATSEFLYFEGSGNGGLVNLDLPQINLSAAAEARVTFGIHAVWTFGTGSGVELQASTDGGATYTAIFTKLLDSAADNMPATQADDFVGIEVDLSAFAGGTLDLRWVGIDTGNGFNDIAIDNFIVEACLSCVGVAGPVLSGPPTTITVGTDQTICGAIVTIPTVTATDDCPDLGMITNNFDANGANVTGEFPTGTTVVTYSVTDSEGNTTTLDVSVVVSDDVPPTFTSCPVSQTVDLGPGGCETVINFNVAATDNCTSSTGSLATITAGGNGGAVGGAVYFDITNNTGNQLVINAFDMNITANTLVNVFTAPTFVGNSANAGAWTLAAQFDATTGAVSGPFPGNGTLTPATGSLTIAPGVTGIALVTLSAAHNYTNGNGANQSFSNADITIDLGDASNAPFAPGFSPRVFNGAVSYEIVLDPTIVQTAGLPSGSAFPIGMTRNTFVATDAAGNTSTCSFDITVNGFNATGGQLTVNPTVQTSLDPSGACTLVGSDEILEGNIYGCYDDFIITRTPAVAAGFGCPTGPTFMGAVPVTCADIGRPVRVVITDPATGNSQWATIIVEDKTAPELVGCDDVDVSCNGVFLTQFGTQPGTAISSTLPPTVGTITVPPLTAGNLITDLDVSMDISHTWISDLTITLESPAGTEITFFQNGCGNFDDFIVTFDDEDPFCIALDPDACNLIGDGLSSQTLNCAAPAAFDPLSIFDGEDPAGDWTFTVTDGVGGDDGTLNSVVLSFGLTNAINVNSLVSATDNCPGVTTTFSETEIPGSCAQDRQVVRTYIATDASGNTATCSQTITYVLPDLADVEFPTNLDGIDGPMLECTSGYPSIGSRVSLTETRTFTPGTPIVNGGSIQIPVAITGFPADAQIEDLDISLDIAYSTSGDLIIDYGRQFDPNPTSILANQCGGGNDILATFDDSGFAQYDCATFDPALKGTFQPNGSLADFNGQSPNGTFILYVEDFDGTNFDFGSVDEITFSITYSTATLITAPTINGQPFDQLACQINITFDDTVIDVCPTSYKVRRKFTVIDMCTGDDIEVNQIIAVMDQDAPIVECPRSELDNPIDLIALSNQSYQNQTSQYGTCLGDITVPPVTVLADNCSGVATVTTELYAANGTQLGAVSSNGGTFFQLPLDDGIFISATEEPSIRYTARYIVEDNCGNQEAVEVFYNVIERTAPVADCDEITNVSLTGTDTTFVSASVFDDGSYDVCSDVHFYVRRMQPTNDLVAYGNYFESRNLKTFLPFKFRERVAFTCDDQNVMVYFLVVDDFVQGYIEFFVNTFIPSLPPAVRNNPNLPYTIWNDGTFYLSTFPGIGGETKDIWQGHYNICMVDVEVEDKVAPIKLLDAPDRTIVCTDAALRQQYVDDTNITFDAPVFQDNCDFTVTLQVIDGTTTCGDGVIRRRFSATDINGNQSVICEQRITSVLEHDYTILWPRDEDRNMCTAGVLGDTLSRPNSLIEDGCDLLAVSYVDQRFATNDDACYKILRTYDVINWCEWDGFSTPVQIGNPTFTTAGPRLDVVVSSAGAQDVRINFNPVAITSVGRWSYVQQIKVYDEEDPILGTITQAPCEAANVVDNVGTFGCGQSVSVDFELTDNCGGLTPPTYRLVAFTGDVDGDGVISAAELAAGVSFANDPFAGSLSSPAGSTSSVAQSGTFNISGTYPLGDHVFVVTARDLCGNEAEYYVPFTAEDCKAPTPKALSFITIDLMATGMVPCTAAHIDNGSFDGCGPVKLSYSANVNDTLRVFTCADLGTNPVQLWVTDAAGNQDFVDVDIIIQDNLGACSGTTPRISASLTTAGGMGVEGAGVSVSGGATMAATTDVNGVTGFDVTAGGDYTISALLDADPANGVTTYDLYLIGQHILGVTDLTTFSQLTAADANANGSISAFDMTVIRRVILGLDQNFRDNTSWRFFDANDTSSEVVSFNDVQANVAADFVAVKTGDVNGTAQANSRQALAPRTLVGEFALVANDAVLAAGETQVVSFNASEVALGYQLTLEWDASALEVVSVNGAAHNAADFGKHLLAEGKLTMSHNGSMEGELFSLEVRALRDGVALSEVMSAGSSVTTAEAYSAEGTKSVAVRFGGSVAGAGNALEQNRPNPFAGTTQIGFTLAEAGAATLTVTDVTGRVVWRTAGQFDAGRTQVEIAAGELPSAGLLNYTLTAGDFTATRKMVVIK